MQMSACTSYEMRALRMAVSASRAISPCTAACGALRPRALLRPPPQLQQQRAALRHSTLQAALSEGVSHVPSQGNEQQSQPGGAVEGATSGAPAGQPGGPQQAQQQQQQQAQQAVRPADDDRARFQLHWSVDMWRTFYPSKWLESIGDETAPVPERIRAFTDTLASAVSTAGILGSSEAARYWAYHLTRSGFFMLQGLAGLVATRGVVGQDADSPSLSRFEGLVKRGWSGPLTEAMLMFYQDHENIKEGRYALPWDMTTSGHRQFNPLFILQRASAFLGEAAATLRRRDSGIPEPVWLKSGLLPDYYQTTFHYQTDGWLSPASAKAYETSTETLFVGRQDAMQRSTLVPLSDFLAGKDASQLKALEVAAGTGRFATFVKDNWPALQLTVSDLSPFYLAEARSNMQYWKRMRAPDTDFGGPDGSGVTFLQTAAEKLDVPDESQDIVYAIYLFHELPADVRKQAVKEMARVLKPGGICILTDSMQLGDRDVYEKTMGGFSNFNEPYYQDYISTPLGPLFEAAGLKCGMKVQGSTTKALSFYKPTQEDLFAMAGSQAAGAMAAAAEVAAEAQEDE